MSVLVLAEGVLWASRDRPILEGFQLMHLIGQSERLIFCTSGTEARMLHQLRTERLADFIDSILDKTVDLPPLPLWQRQIEVARSRGHVSMVICSNPTVFDWSLEHGMPAMLFGHPKFAAPPRRPDQASRSWEELLEEMEARP